jgi:hypothetical protein
MKRYVITEHGQVWHESKFRARFYESARSAGSKCGPGHVLLDRADVPSKRAPIHLLGHAIPYATRQPLNKYNRRPDGHR